MTYDRALAERIRQALADEPSVREVRMFGGLSFMVRGKLALSATGLGDLLVRCDPERVNDLLDAPGSEWAEMNGRRMARGWIRVGPAGIESEEQFEGWIEAALDYSERITTARDS